MPVYLPACIWLDDQHLIPEVMFPSDYYAAFPFVSNYPATCWSPNVALTPLESLWEVLGAHWGLLSASDNDVLFLGKADAGSVIPPMATPTSFYMPDPPALVAGRDLSARGSREWAEQWMELLRLDLTYLLYSSRAY